MAVQKGRPKDIWGYIDQGIQILELAQQAHSLYVRQNVREKRRLLDTVLWNCTLDDVTLYPTYRKPFDLIAEGVRMQVMHPRIGIPKRALVGWGEAGNGTGRQGACQDHSLSADDRSRPIPTLRIRTLKQNGDRPRSGSHTQNAPSLALTSKAPSSWFQMDPPVVRR